MSTIRQKYWPVATKPAVVWLLWVILASGQVSGQKPGEPGYCPEPCHCINNNRVVICIGLSLRHVPSLPPTVKQLYLDSNILGTINNATFPPLPQLELLSLENNQLTHIGLSTFKGMKKLKTLRLGQNDLLLISEETFRDCPTILDLDLHGNLLESIPDVSLHYLSSLRVLNMSYNQIDSPFLGPGFKYTTKLSVLDLSGNNFQKLNPHVFQAMLWWDADVRQHLNLSFCNIKRIAKAGLSKLYNLESLTLAGNTDIPPSDLRDALIDLEVSQMRYLDFSYMNLTDIYEIFHGLSQLSIVNLDLSHNQIRQLQKGVFANMGSSLRQLDLSHNLFDDIGDFIGLRALEHLDLSFNNLTTLNQWSFDTFPRLLSLNLAQNKLANITNSPFTQLFDLKLLDLTKNQLVGFEINSALEHLETLLVPGNRLTSLGSISRLLKLKTLDISNNLLRKLGANLFPHGHALKIANFSNNEINDIDDSAFDSYTPEHIDFSNNRIAIIKNFGWRGAKWINLQRNKIRNVTSDAMLGLSSLKQLDLSFNRLQSLPVDVFRNSSSLEFLSMTGNSLGNFLSNENAGTILSHLIRLKVLSLEKIGLSTITNALFTNLTALVYLDLSRNGVSVIRKSSLKHLQLLKFLNLSRNNISSIDPGVFRVLGTLRVLDLSQNPYVCDCGTLPFQRWVRQATDNAVPYLRNRNQITCSTPPALEGTPLVDYTLNPEVCNPPVPNHTPTIVAVLVSFAVVVVVGAAFVFFRYRHVIKTKLARSNYRVLDDEQTLQTQGSNGRVWV